MADRKRRKANRADQLARLETENARLRRLAAELAGDVGELQPARGERRRDGAVDPAHRLLVAAAPRE